GQGPQPADPPGLALGGKEGEPQVLLGRLLRAGERETVAGRAGDAVERPRPRQQTHEAGGVPERLRGGDGAVQEYSPMLEPAQVDGERPGVDPDHTGHAPYLGFALNSRATSAIVSASSMTPAGPALSSKVARSQARLAWPASDIVIACTVPPKRFTTSSRARSPASGLRDVMTTSAPARANSPAARIPTGPVPATMRTRWPRTSPAAWTIFSTAATAVVLEPFESSMS